MSEKRKFSGWLKGVLLVVIVAVLIVLVWLFLRPKETYTSAPITASKMQALTCASTDMKEAFFGFDYAISNRHEIKVMFGEERANSISYNYYGSFESNDIAKTADSSMHGKYNKYLGERNLSQQSLNPVFAVMDKDTKVSLYAKSNEITSMTAMFFFIDGDEFQRFGSRSIDEMKTMYENKGFACQDTR